MVSGFLNFVDRLPTGDFQSVVSIAGCSTTQLDRTALTLREGGWLNKW
jgi:hypothetical protein